MAAGRAGEIRYGIIGYNEGNGHPYSFSAIMNGYDPAEMKTAFPAIAAYLEKRNKSEFGIANARMAAVWTQDRKRSESIAAASIIPVIADDFKDLAEHVDAVIIARDDVETHHAFASFFLEKNIPVFIDKPLCSTAEELSYYIPFLENGLLMSCSGFRYYPAIVSRMNGSLDESPILYASSHSILNWMKYGIHVLEGLADLFEGDAVSVTNMGNKGADVVRVEYSSGQYHVIMLHEKSAFILNSNLFTEKKNHVIHYDDNFSCFRELLFRFDRQVRSGIPAIAPASTINIIKTLIGAEISRTEKRTVLISEL